VATTLSWDSGVGTAKVGCHIVDKDYERGWIAGGDPKHAMEATTTTMIVAVTAVF